MRQLNQFEIKLIEESVAKNNYNEAQKTMLTEAVLSGDPCDEHVTEVKALFVGSILISYSKSVGF